VSGPAGPPDAAGYSGTPLPRKLGIKEGAQVLLVGAPDLPALAELPAGVVISHRAAAGPYDVIVLFCPDAATLADNFQALSATLTTAGALWVGWPKKSSKVATDLGEQAVRDHGLTAGLVDVKVAAIDSTWSGLKFVRRVRDR
jgi:hypothetical protein